MEELWGQEHFVPADASADLVARIESAIDALLGCRWLALAPVALERRWGLFATGDRAPEAITALDEFRAQRRARSSPHVLVRLLEPPRSPYVLRRDRASRHAEIPRLEPGQRMGLVLEDWFHRAGTAGPVPSAEVFFPQFVTVRADERSADPWSVELGHVVLFEDGRVLRAPYVDITASRIRAGEDAEPLGSLEELESG